MPTENPDDPRTVLGQLRRRFETHAPDGSACIVDVARDALLALAQCVEQRDKLLDTLSKHRPMRGPDGEPDIDQCEAEALLARDAISTLKAENARLAAENARLRDEMHVLRLQLKLGPWPDTPDAQTADIDRREELIECDMKDTTMEELRSYHACAMMNWTSALDMRDIAQKENEKLRAETAALVEAAQRVRDNQEADRVTGLYWREDFVALTTALAPFTRANKE